MIIFKNIVDIFIDVFIENWHAGLLSLALFVALALAMVVLSIVIKKPKVRWSIIISLIISGVFCAIHLLIIRSYPYGDFTLLAQICIVILSVFIGPFVFIAIMSIRFAIISLKSNLGKALKISIFLFFLFIFIVFSGITLSIFIWFFGSYLR